MTFDVEAVRRLSDPENRNHTFREYREVIGAACDEITRLRTALQIIADKIYPATYVGINEYGVEIYGSYDDASNYARRVLDGEQIT